MSAPYCELFISQLPLDTTEFPFSAQGAQRLNEFNIRARSAHFLGGMPGKGGAVFFDFAVVLIAALGGFETAGGLAPLRVGAFSGYKRLKERL
jgi:hypothetical protein